MSEKTLVGLLLAACAVGCSSDPAMSEVRTSEGINYRSELPDGQPGIHAEVMFMEDQHWMAVMPDDVGFDVAGVQFRITADTRIQFGAARTNSGLAVFQNTDDAQDERILMLSYTGARIPTERAEPWVAWPMNTNEWPAGEALKVALWGMVLSDSDAAGAAREAPRVTEMWRP